jgi:hypothetical protein
LGIFRATELEKECFIQVSVRRKGNYCQRRDFALIDPEELCDNSGTDDEAYL